MRERRPKHLQSYKDRHGRERIYLRKPGEKRIPLPGPLYSPAFWTAYYAALEGVAVPKITNRNEPGSVSAAIAGYYKSAELRRCRFRRRKTTAASWNCFARSTATRGWPSSKRTTLTA